MKKLHTDIETYSSIDLKSSGMYAYSESFDFEILMIAYAFDEGEVKIVDLAMGEKIPYEFQQAMRDPSVEKHAHNAAFERTCFNAIGFGTEIDQWHCSAVKSAYCGLPRSLEEVSAALKLGDEGKSAEGKALIRFFSVPCKATKKNGGRMRNQPHHDPEKWQRFKDYCVQDVVAERAIENKLLAYIMPSMDRELYVLDQEINDRGVELDMELVNSAIAMNEENAGILMNRMKEVSGLENPNSPTQMKTWLTAQLGRTVGSLTIESVKEMLAEAERIEDSESAEDTIEMLKLRQKTSKSAIKKYYAARNGITASGRIKGMFLFYGASRTGRWSGRLMQLHNMKRNSMKGLARAREAIKSRDLEFANMLYGDVSDVLAQLIRTTLVAKYGHTFAVADFSAIEARVIAWLAGEQWRIDLFKAGGDIYIQSYAQMMGIPVSEVTKDDRSKGKVAELACGYQGSVGALTKMGGEKMGLSQTEMKTIVNKWRDSNPNIVALWKALEVAAKKAIIRKAPQTVRGIEFRHDGYALIAKLPSGRELFYKGAQVVEGVYGTKIKYQGVDQDTKRWGWLDTYGGKLSENIVQAIARDLLAETQIELKSHGFKICMHVHDENIAEVKLDNAVAKLEEMNRIMGKEISWAKGLPLNAEGYLTPFYKKD